MSMYYLVGTEAVPCEDAIAWAERFHNANRRVAYTDITESIHVSTVFLGVDHQYCDDGPPLLFETMIFWANGPLDLDQERYSTWHQAEQGHQHMVDKVRAQLAVLRDELPTLPAQE